VSADDPERGVKKKKTDTKTESKGTWRDNCWSVVSKLMSPDFADDHKYFLHAVDVTVYTDYLNVVRFPMDFSTIARKLMYAGYDNEEAVWRDLHLIHENCVSYQQRPANDASSVDKNHLIKCAKKLKRRILSMREKWGSGEISSSTTLSSSHSADCDLTGVASPPGPFLMQQSGGFSAGALVSNPTHRPLQWVGGALSLVSTASSEHATPPTFPSLFPLSFPRFEHSPNPTAEAGGSGSR
jgi:hypothetical protein